MRDNGRMNTASENPSMDRLAAAILSKLDLPTLSDVEDVLPKVLKIASETSQQIRQADQIIERTATWGTNPEGDRRIWDGAACLGLRRTVSPTGSPLFKVGLWVRRFCQDPALQDIKTAMHLWGANCENGALFKRGQPMFLKGIKDVFVTFHNTAEIDTPRQIRSAAEALTGQMVRVFYKHNVLEDGTQVNHIHRIEPDDDEFVQHDNDALYARIESEDDAVSDPTTAAKKTVAANAASPKPPAV